LYLNQKQAQGSENQGVTGHGLNLKTQTINILEAITTNLMGPNNRIQTLAHSTHHWYRTPA